MRGLQCSATMSNSASQAPNARGRRPGRRLVFGLIALVIIGLVVELAAAVAWWGMTGEPFTWGRAAAARHGSRRSRHIG